MWSRFKQGLYNAAKSIGVTMSGLMLECEDSLFSDLTLATEVIDPKNSFKQELVPLFVKLRTNS